MILRVKIQVNYFITDHQNVRRTHRVESESRVYTALHGFELQIENREVEDNFG